MDKKRNGLQNEELETTPTIPVEIYEKLPKFLKDCTNEFTDPREKDVVLLGCLVILSGSFSELRGRYNKDMVSPNLYAFIVAPAASGKGTMKYAKLLGQPIQDRYLEINRRKRAEYASQVKEFEANVRKKDNTNFTPPEKRKFPVLFIPGNSSAAAVYNLLHESYGKGIMCESEADTLSGSLKQDWGNYSDMLRKAFHNETLSLSRKAQNEYIEIVNPRLSTLLTGTPDQVPKLISSAENGLSSRIIYYCYSRDLKWIDPTPCRDCADLGHYFTRKGEEVTLIADKLNEGGFSFSLTDEQFKKLSVFFEKKVDLIKMFEGEGASSAVFRLGLICFRIAMVLTACSIDLKKIGYEMICSDEDFDTSLALIDVFFEHSMVVYASLPMQAKVDIKPGVRSLYSALPEGIDFPRMTANEKGKELNISEKSVGNYLNELTKLGYVESTKFGFYKKVKQGS